jgi:hypothetical protein
VSRRFTEVATTNDGTRTGRSLIDLLATIQQVSLVMSERLMWDFSAQRGSARPIMRACRCSFVLGQH